MIIPNKFIQVSKLVDITAYRRGITYDFKGYFIILVLMYDPTRTIFSYDKYELFRGEINPYYNYMVEFVPDQWGYFSVVFFDKFFDDAGRLNHIEFYFDKFSLFPTWMTDDVIRKNTEEYIHRFLVPSPASGLEKILNDISK